jgi:O-antigen ligase
VHKETINSITSQIRELETGRRVFNLLNQSVPVLIGIFIFFNSFPHTTAIKEICFYLSIFIVFFLFLFKETDFSFKTPLSVPFAIFVVWAFIGIFFALDKENSIHDFRAHLLKYLALYYLLVNFFNSKKRFEVLSWIIIVSAAVFSIGGMIYFYLILKNPIPTRLGIEFLELHVDYIGFVTLFAILLTLHHFSRESILYRKLILLVCLLGTSMATMLTQSKGTLVAAVFAFIVLFPKNKKTLIVFLILFLIGMGITPRLKNRFALTNILNAPRIGINLTTYEVIKDYPITGIGFGMQTYGNKNLLDLDKYNARIPPKYRQASVIGSPHNSLADVAMRTGIVGLVLYLYILFMCIRMGWKTIRYGRDDFIKEWGLCIMAAFVGIFIQGIFSDGMFGPQAIVLYTIFAMMTILWRLDNVKIKDSDDVECQKNSCRNPKIWSSWWGRKICL